MDPPKGSPSEVGRDTLRILREDPGAAVARMRERIAQGKADYRTWHNLAVALRNTGDLEGALDAVDNALDRAEDSVPSHFLRGTLLREADRLEDALEAFGRAASLQPDSARVHANRGVLYFFLHQPERAVEELERAVELDPEDLGSLFNLAVVSLARKKYRRAQQIFLRLSELEPDKRSYYGQFLVELGRVQATEEISSQAHRIKNFLGIIGDRLRRFCDHELESLRREAREDLLDIREDHERVYFDLVVLLGAIRPRPLRLEPVDVRRLIDRIVFVAVKPGDTVEVKREIPEDLPPLHCDVDTVQEAFLNLLLNALEATRAAPSRGAPVRIRAEREGDSLEISFLDEGVGIARGDLERVFQFGFTTKSQGTGIGLAQTRRVIENHGGSIDVTSEEGKGSAFRVTLPLQPRLSETVVNLTIRSQLLVNPRDLILEEADQDLGI